MLGMPFHRPSQLRGHYREALTQRQRRDCHIAQLELHAHKKAIRAHVINLRRFKNIRAVRNKEAGDVMHDSRAVGTRKGENELGFRSVMRLWVPSNDQAI